jgi:hypothetical protein
MSRFLPPRRPGSSRLAIIASTAVLVAVIAGFAWISVLSYNLIHTEPLGRSKLRPVKTIGPEQIVFRWKRDACEPRDIPDAPARAFRDANGDVHLLASHYVNRQATGPNLDRVRHRCDVVMRSAYDSRPSEFEDREWLFSPYTLDGNTVFALVHDEYHGENHPGRCPSGNPSGINQRCWYNAITLVRSDDRGATFHLARPAPGHLVAEVPYRYQPDMPRYGLFAPSNIVQKDGYYYSLVSTAAYRKQEQGTCVMRTKRLDDPTAWRAWDGDGFNVSFVDPYKAKVEVDDHICKPVSVPEISDMTFSLTYNTYFHKYLLVSPANEYVPGKRRVVSGFYYSLSSNLVDWSPRKLIKEVTLIQTYRCGDPDAVFYPSILDPSSKSRNFETSGRRPYLYFTRLHYKACQLTYDRDLVRVPVEFSK